MIYRQHALGLEAVIGSFKLKLVFWFALLALVPLGIAFYGYDALAKRSETTPDRRPARVGPARRARRAT